MPRKNLTARFCETVRVDERTDFQDEIVRGLALRVSPNGVKAWNVRYNRDADGSKQRVTLGRFPAITLDRARARALKLMAAVHEGSDPAGDRQAKRNAMTFMDLGELYIEKYAKRNKKTWAEDERILKREVYPSVGRLKAHAVKRRDLLDIIEAKAEAGYGAQSRQVLAVIRKLCNWAVDSDYLEISPALGLRPRAKATRRDRVLSPAEIRTIWNALPDAPLSDEARDIFRLLFLTGQRAGEVCGMIESEVDLDAAMWTLPASRTKNSTTHNVPLAPDALDIARKWIGQSSPDEADSPLFSRIGVPIESNAISKAARLKLQITGEHWTPHDIRRTVATGMAEIGIQPHIVEACLNHISGFRAGVAGTYNRALYDREKRNALDRWAAHLRAVINAKQAAVVPLRAGAQ